MTNHEVDVDARHRRISRVRRRVASSTAESPATGSGRRRTTRNPSWPYHHCSPGAPGGQNSGRCILGKSEAGQDPPCLADGSSEEGHAPRQTRLDGVSARLRPPASPRAPSASPCAPRSASATTSARSSASASASCATLESVPLWWMPCFLFQCCLFLRELARSAICNGSEGQAVKESERITNLDSRAVQSARRGLQFFWYFEGC